ncbi:flagellar type III secretion system protein FlhB [Ruixingdingia sedimenti]|uniref:Flagellar type III secretion system protein FlhB n=1 Tax=Ruixingdingia sedimenti TaxID=3073604 RepID=A0ABU1F777_9RHOB|nr:flagellar type III secretion system protein FlhB [Xinfangfangia sp. LG-4]MDR5652716.1 flagellar type III secretion system protein FlhB [Xinfangfangia sp. LG-4]
MSEEDGAEKEFDPSERKLEEAREKGDIPRQQDLLTAAAYGGFLLAALALGPRALSAAAQAGAVLLDQADSLAPALFGGGAALPAGIAAGMAGILPFFLLPMAAVIVALVALRGLVFAPDKLLPKLSRISPIRGIKNRFGLSGLVEFAKSVLKMLAVSTVMALYLSDQFDSLRGVLHLEPAQAVAVLLRMLAGFLAIVLAVQGVVGLADLLWQRFDHRRRHRMTRKEMTDEVKNAEGDPHIKAQRRQRGTEIAMNRMLADVPRADVVIVNPTHYAVALKWNRQDRHAPICLAKGVDEIAARIRDRAAEAGVPIHRDPPTARAIHATVAVGTEIRREHYRAVAAAIRFAERMRQRARERGKK